MTMTRKTRYKVGPFDLRERLVKQMDAKLLTSEFTILQMDPPKVLLVNIYLLIYWGANGTCICTLFEVKIFSEMKRKSFHAK